MNGRAERQKWMGAGTPFLDDTTCPSHQGLVLVSLSEKLFNTKNYSADNLAPVQARTDYDRSILFAEEA